MRRGALDAERPADKRTTGRRAVDCNVGYHNC